MKNIILFIFLTGIFTTCTKEDVAPCACVDNRACTEEYRILNIEITNAAGQPYILDSYYTTKVEDNLKFNLQTDSRDSLASITGEYPVAEDQLFQFTDRCGKEFKFTGIKNGVEVISQTYTVAHDCCHVVINEGEVKIVVN
ncbi:hypothetical protein [Dyadobacter sp. CY312]|uniref:hypothetical protein n=1 Tax=Dyadobacter sp. CY312 TaxID=2907303 RepID=UPI001F1FCD56|nr:hypothetical protein [Dyadobacter sp. CY312]MCE7038802.1 hypothetical protein [Dyadobacter sp. CY312]